MFVLENHDKNFLVDQIRFVDYNAKRLQSPSWTTDKTFSLVHETSYALLLR